MAVNSNPLSPGYGKITLLQLPQDTAIPGPQQVQNNFEADSRAASQLTLLRQGGSKVTLGNLVTVPLGGSLLSVEPVYVSLLRCQQRVVSQLKKFFVLLLRRSGSGEVD